MEDQAGNTIHIPLIEKKALMVAMALHEKGKSSMKKRDYAKALVYLLDADAEFRYNIFFVLFFNNVAIIFSKYNSNKTK